MLTLLLACSAGLEKYEQDTHTTVGRDSEPDPGETGPIELYASPKAISGRAGLFPSRYQSDKVDRGGNLSRFRNGRLRAAWLLVADNLIKCNAYWRGKYNHWKSQGHDPRDIRCRIANRVTRTVFQMGAGRQVFRHPSRLDRGYFEEAARLSSCALYITNQILRYIICSHAMLKII